jgi:hypothetical protein
LNASLGNIERPCLQRERERERERREGGIEGGKEGKV